MPQRSTNHVSKSLQATNDRSTSANDFSFHLNHFKHVKCAASSIKYTRLFSSQKRCFIYAMPCRCVQFISFFKKYYFSSFRCFFVYSVSVISLDIIRFLQLICVRVCFVYFLLHNLNWRKKKEYNERMKKKKKNVTFNKFLISKTFPLQRDNLFISEKRLKLMGTKKA